MDMEFLINQPGATLVDVRTTEEFEDGSVSGAINIPLHTIPARIEEFRGFKAPVVCFCRSGARSFQAVTFLKQQGIETFDGGGINEMMLMMKQ